MAQASAFFRAGLKLIGILSILWALTHIVGVVFSLYSVFNQPDVVTGDVLRSYRFSLIFQIAFPIVLFAIGVYLLKSETVLQLAFQNMELEGRSDVERFFLLLMKLVGLVLVVYAIPKAFQLIGNIFFIVSFHGLFSAKQQIQTVTSSFIRTVIELLLGFYLLASGKLFYRIGFSEKDQDE